MEKETVCLVHGTPVHQKRCANHNAQLPELYQAEWLPPLDLATFLGHLSVQFGNAIHARKYIPVDWVELLSYGCSCYPCHMDVGKCANGGVLMKPMKFAYLMILAVGVVASCAAGDGTKGGEGGDGGEWGGTGATGGTSGSVFDLDSGDALWLTYSGGKALVLFTYKNDANVFLDVQESPKGAIQGQYNGSRLGSVATGYTLNLECLNPGSSLICDQFGTTMNMSCTPVGGPQLVCGSMVFTKVTSADVSP